MFKAWEVGVKLSLINGVSTGIFAMARNFQGLNKDIGGTSARLREVEQRMDRLRKMGAIGAGLAVIGAAGLSAFKGPIDAAKLYENSFSRFKTLNLGAEVNKQANEFARGVKVFGVSSTQLMDTLGATMPLFNDFGMAKTLSPRIAELNRANAVLFGGKVEQIDEGSARSLSKFLDRMGVTNDPAKFMQGMDIAERLVTGSGGAIKFSDLATFSQRGGTAFRDLSPKGISMLAGVLQEQGGSAAGVGLMSMYQNLVAGRTPKKTMGLLAQYGLGELGEIESGSVGGKKIHSTVLKNVFEQDLLRENPVAWLQDVMNKLKGQGVEDSQMTKVINDLVSNRTGSNSATLITSQMFQVLRDAKVTENAMGVVQVLKTLEESPLGKDADLTAKWHTALVELGEVALPAVIRGTETLTGWLRKIIDFSAAHPTAFKALAAIFAATSAIALIGGSILNTAASLSAIAIALQFSGAGGAAGIAASAASLGLLGKSIAWIAAAALAWEAGHAAGSYIYDHASPESKNRLGSVIAHLLAFFGNEDAQNAVRINEGSPDPASKSPFVAPQSSPVVQVQSNLHLDGRKVAEVVTTHQSRSLLRPNSTSGFDPLMSPLPQTVN